MSSTRSSATRSSTDSGLVKAWASSDLASPEAQLRLLQDAERNKIELSADRVDVTFYRPSYFQSGGTLQYH